MRALIIALMVLIAIPAYAQDEKVAALEARIKALEKQQPAPVITKAQKKAHRDMLRLTCENRGLRFKEAHIDSTTGNMFIICR